MKIKSLELLRESSKTKTVYKLKINLQTEQSED